MDRHALKIPCNVMPFICEADYSVTLGEMVHADRTVPFHVAIYLLQGSMEIIEDGDRHLILPNQLFFLKSGVHHWGEKPFEPGSAWYYAHFYCEEPGEGMEELSQKIYYHKKVCLAREENRKYINLPKLADDVGMNRIGRNFEKMIEAYMHGNIPQASVQMWQIFLECVQSVQVDLAGGSCIRQIQEYIQTHYIEDFTAGEIEKTCGLSYKYAGTLFKEATGQTIREYQRMLRLARACKLLKETDRTITEIAQMTGFSEVFYFSKVFRKERGCSPSEYRRTYVPGI